MGGIITAFIFIMTSTKNLQKFQRDIAWENQIRRWNQEKQIFVYIEIAVQALVCSQITGTCLSLPAFSCLFPLGSRLRTLPIPPWHQVCFEGLSCRALAQTDSLRLSSPQKKGRQLAEMAQCVVWLKKVSGDTPSTSLKKV